MRILIDIRSLMTPRLSGVGEYTYRVVDHIISNSKGDEFFLWTNGFKSLGNTVWTSAVRKWNSHDHVHICRTSVPNKVLHAAFLGKQGVHLDALAYRTLDRKGKKERAKVDVVFLPNIHFYSVTPHVRLVVTFHDLSFEMFPEFFSPYGRMWHRLVHPYALARRANAVVAVSENTKRDVVARYSISADRVEVVYPGVYAARSENGERSGDNDRAEEVRRLYRLPSRFFLYLGTIEPRKNLEGLIRAYTHLRALHSDMPPLVIAGSRGWLFRNIYQAANKSPYRRDIRFVGYIREEDKEQVYRNADVFVYPSFYEGFGFPPLEALSCSVPTVAGCAGSLPEVLHNASLIVDPYNIHELAHALYHSVVDVRLRRRLKQRGREHVRRFQWEDTARRMVTLFHSLA